MTPNEIQLEVAKVAGVTKGSWLRFGSSDGHNGRVWSDSGWTLPSGECVVGCPLYHTSYDAILPVIKKSFGKLSCHSFFDALGFECAKDTADCDGQYEYQGDGSYYEQWLIFKATPLQLCIALLKALGKYNE